MSVKARAQLAQQFREVHDFRPSANTEGAWLNVADVVAASIEAARGTLTRETLLATMAADIASGMVSRNDARTGCETERDLVAVAAVDVARRILSKIEAP